jgi:hypothetical protein
MRIRRLQLESWQMARLSVVTQMARLSIDAPIRKIKSIQQQRAQMIVNRENPSLEIDIQDIRGSVGRSSVNTLVQASASRAYNIRQSINNGSYNSSNISALSHRGNPIILITRSRISSANQSDTSQAVIDGIASVKGNPGSLSIDWSLQDITISWDEYQAPVITIEPKPSVNVELAQEPFVEFKVVEQAYPPETGGTIDEAV